jgi:hypothetical protein
MIAKAAGQSRLVNNFSNFMRTHELEAGQGAANEQRERAMVMRSRATVGRIRHMPTT